MKFIAISGDTLLLSLFGIATAIVILIVILRRFTNNQKKNPTLTKEPDVPTLASRNKYTCVNTFRLTRPLFNFGLLTALVMTILAFSWTTYEPQVEYTVSGTIDMDVLEVTPPRTDVKPPPPPEPPPSVIDIVEPDEAEDLPEIEFVSMEIDEPVAPPAPPAPVVKKITPPAPEPPPPAVEPEVVTIHSIVEEMPRFPGCESMNTKTDRADCSQQKLLAFIYKNIDYPTIARETGIEGTVVIRFFIDEEGQVQAPEIVKEIGGGCGKEALRVVNMMNDLPENWSPGRQRGKAVKVYFNLPVKYRLN